jgi:hypothetical protein
MKDQLIRFRLTGEEAEALSALAKKELRGPSQQAYHLVRVELCRRGLLNTESGESEAWQRAEESLPVRVQNALARAGVADLKGLMEEITRHGIIPAPSGGGKFYVGGGAHWDGFRDVGTVGWQLIMDALYSCGFDWRAHRISIEEWRRNTLEWLGEHDGD